MKKQIYDFKVIAGVILLAILLTQSCDRLGEDPDYIGTWQYTEKTYMGEVTVNITHTLKLTDGYFEEVIIYRRDNTSAVMTLLGLKGSISVSNDELNFTLTAVGECLKDAVNNCTATVEWFPKGSQTYNDYLTIGMSESFSGTFEADEYYLWLVRDMNNDTDTDDDWEDIEFERL